MPAKKRIISAILCFAMLIGMYATTFATTFSAGPIPDIAGVTQEAYMKEVEDTIKGYIRMKGMNTSNLSMSQPMPIYGADAENMRDIFLFRDKKCIGIMALAYVDNEYASSFVAGDCDPITDACNKNQSIALVSGEYYLVLFTDDGWSFVSGLEDSVDEAALNKTGNSYERQVLSLTPIVFSDEEAM